MSSIKEQEQQEQKKQEWKWETNHDGVIWSWSHSSSCSFDYTSRPVDKQGQEKQGQEKQAIPVKPVKYVVQEQKKEKKSLIDYWYVIHDGTVIPTGDQ